MTRCRREITFFHSNPVERQSATPVAAAAERRGYVTRMSEDPFAAAEVGVYCAHDCFPRHARVSIAMLHDMGQGQLHWPNMWRYEPWNEFDAGVLPGDVWARRWQASCAHPFTRPRHGVFKLGWPKSDAIFAHDDDDLSAGARELRAGIDLQHAISVLYAPAWENDGKQDEFVRALKNLPVNLLLKQYPWTDEWPDMLENVAAANALHRDIAPNVHIIDPGVSIMYAIELADIVVSEESSCLIEALLKGLPAVSVSDWLIPDTQPARLPAAPFDFLIRTPKAQLGDTIAAVIEDMPQHKATAAAQRDENFCNLGHAADAVVDLIDALVEERPIPFAPVAVTAAPAAASLRDQYKKHLRRGVFRLKHRLGVKQPLMKIAYDLLTFK